jgi:Cu+-exporting ATPase
MSAFANKNAIACFHCGEDCSSTPVIGDDKNFCCEGCKMVYSILSEKAIAPHILIYSESC